MDIDVLVDKLKTELSMLEKDLLGLLHQHILRPMYDTSRELRVSERPDHKYLGHFNEDITAHYHCVNQLMRVFDDYQYFVYMMTEDDAHELTGKILACRDTVVSMDTAKFYSIKLAKKVYSRRYEHYAKVAPLTKSAYLGDKLNKLYSEAP